MNDDGSWEFVCDPLYSSNDAINAATPPSSPTPLPLPTVEPTRQRPPPVLARVMHVRLDRIPERATRDDRPGRSLSVGLQGAVLRPHGAAARNAEPRPISLVCNSGPLASSECRQSPSTSNFMKSSSIDCLEDPLKPNKRQRLSSRSDDDCRSDRAQSSTSMDTSREGPGPCSGEEVTSAEEDVGGGSRQSPERDAAIAEVCRHESGQEMLERAEDRQLLCQVEAVLSSARRGRWMTAQAISAKLTGETLRSRPSLKLQALMRRVTHVVSTQYLHITGGTVQERQQVSSTGREYRLLENANCEVCHRTDGDREMILCDGCALGWHMTCLSGDAELLELPGEDDTWLCPNCEALRQTLQSHVVEGLQHVGHGAWLTSHEILQAVSHRDHFEFQCQVPTQALSTVLSFGLESDELGGAPVFLEKRIGTCRRFALPGAACSDPGCCSESAEPEQFHLCSTCGRGWHLDCLPAGIQELEPGCEGSWQCAACEASSPPPQAAATSGGGSDQAGGLSGEIIRLLGATPLGLWLSAHEITQRLKAAGYVFKAFPAFLAVKGAIRKTLAECSNGNGSASLMYKPGVQQTAGHCIRRHKYALASRACSCSSCRMATSTADGEEVLLCCLCSQGWHRCCLSQAVSQGDGQEELGWKCPDCELRRLQVTSAPATPRQSEQSHSWRSATDNSADSPEEEDDQASAWATMTTSDVVQRAHWVLQGVDRGLWLSLTDIAGNLQVYPSGANESSASLPAPDWDTLRSTVQAAMLTSEEGTRSGILIKPHSALEASSTGRPIIGHRYALPTRACAREGCGIVIKDAAHVRVCKKCGTGWHEECLPEVNSDADPDERASPLQLPEDCQQDPEMVNGWHCPACMADQPQEDSSPPYCGLTSVQLSIWGVLHSGEVPKGTWLCGRELVRRMEEQGCDFRDQTTVAAKMRTLIESVMSCRLRGGKQARAMFLTRTHLCPLSDDRTRFAVATKACSCRGCTAVTHNSNGLHLCCACGKAWHPKCLPAEPWPQQEPDEQGCWLCPECSTDQRQKLEQAIVDAMTSAAHGTKWMTTAEIAEEVSQVCGSCTRSSAVRQTIREMRRRMQGLGKGLPLLQRVVSDRSGAQHFEFAMPREAARCEECGASHGGLGDMVSCHLCAAWWHTSCLPPGHPQQSQGCSSGEQWACPSCKGPPGTSLLTATMTAGGGQGDPLYLECDPPPHTDDNPADNDSQENLKVTPTTDHVSPPSHSSGSKAALPPNKAKTCPARAIKASVNVPCASEAAPEAEIRPHKQPGQALVVPSPPMCTHDNAKDYLANVSLGEEQSEHSNEIRRSTHRLPGVVDQLSLSPPPASLEDRHEESAPGTAEGSVPIHFLKPAPCGAAPQVAEEGKVSRHPWRNGAEADCPCPAPTPAVAAETNDGPGLDTGSKGLPDPAGGMSGPGPQATAVLSACDGMSTPGHEGRATADISLSRTGGQVTLPSPSEDVKRAEEYRQTTTRLLSGEAMAEPPQCRHDEANQPGVASHREEPQPSGHDDAIRESLPTPGADGALVPFCAPGTARPPLPREATIKFARRASVLKMPGLRASAYKVCTEMLSFEECMALLSGQAGDLVDMAVDLVEARLQVLLS